MPQFTTTKRLYLNTDKSRVVEEDDPDAASLLAAEGQVVSAEDAEKYGLSAPEPQTEAPAEGEAEPPADAMSEAGQAKGKAVKADQVQDKSISGPRE